MEKRRKLNLLDEACRPPSVGEEAIAELYRERKLDEERLERKIRLRRKRAG